MSGKSDPNYFKYFYTLQCKNKLFSSVAVCLYTCVWYTVEFLIDIYVYKIYTWLIYYK